MEWQPISSAPKDGTSFLGVRVSSGKSPVIWLITGLHMEYGSLNDDGTKGLTWNGQGALYGIKITHWMPLPIPPAIQPDK